MRKQDTRSGLFVQLGDRPLIKKCYMVNPDDDEALRRMLKKGESMSDKVREAIAYYIQNQENAR